MEVMSRSQTAAEAKQHVIESDSLQGGPETVVLVEPKSQWRSWAPGNASTMEYQLKKAMGTELGQPRELHVLQLADSEGWHQSRLWEPK